MTQYKFRIIIIIIISYMLNIAATTNWCELKAASHT